MAIVSSVSSMMHLAAVWVLLLSPCLRQHFILALLVWLAPLHHSSVHACMLFALTHKHMCHCCYCWFWCDCHTGGALLLCTQCC